MRLGLWTGHAPWTLGMRLGRWTGHAPWTLSWACALDSGLGMRLGLWTGHAPCTLDWACALDSGLGMRLGLWEYTWDSGIHLRLGLCALDSATWSMGMRLGVSICILGSRAAPAVRAVLAQRQQAIPGCTPDSSGFCAAPGPAAAGGHPGVLAELRVL
eukprot:gene15718-biopygen12259